MRDSKHLVKVSTSRETVLLRNLPHKITEFTYGLTVFSSDLKVASDLPQMAGCLQGRSLNGHPSEQQLHLFTTKMVLLSIIAVPTIPR
ncbi:hypothetical protein J6590_079011 [Homalodisca vitripennis]|nr:hypothetical protein J6590_079011 [Homalodisca vitripennis]